MHVPPSFPLLPVLVTYKVLPGFYPCEQRAEGLKGCENMAQENNSQADGEDA